VLGWKPQHDLASGLRANIETVLHATAEWTYNYISANCPSSNVLEVSQGPNVLLSNRNNKDLTRLDGCTVNIAFERDGFLDHVKCPSRGTETECTVDNAYVASYNWDASVFIIRRQKTAGNRQKEKERQVRVSFEEEKGRGVLGLLKGDSVFELLPTGTEGQSVFDLEVSWHQLPRNSPVLMSIRSARMGRTSASRFPTPMLSLLRGLTSSTMRPSSELHRLRPSMQG